MGSSLGGMLSVDKTVVLLGLGALRVHQGYFNILTAQVNDVVDDFSTQGVLEEVLQAVLGKVLFSVEVNGQSRVQVHVVPNHFLHVFHLEPVVGEQAGVRGKDYFGSASAGGFLHRRLFHQNTLLKNRRFGLVVADGLNQKSGRQRVHSLRTYPIQSNRLFKCFGIVLGPGIHLGDGIHHLAQGDAPAKVAHRHGTVLDGNFHGFPRAHHKLVDGVVHHLLDQDVNTVVGGRAVPHFANVHPRAEPNVLLPLQAPDVVFVVLNDVGHALKVRV